MSLTKNEAQLGYVQKAIILNVTLNIKKILHGNSHRFIKELISTQCSGNQLNCVKTSKNTNYNYKYVIYFWREKKYKMLNIAAKIILCQFSKIASEAPIASEATQSAVKKVLSKHKNPIACPECGKLMKNERGVKQHIAKMHK
ncbi:hypothetical protein BpHYR1_009595 [Brachionus plicatilis]|uniref:C2H2-type domain-containing protein n=1 Tax=Brachionus plicatilis TaxID=10195 RepID=A0A3M7T5J1_BRAPC|nr:hypothetical protein BpHYR1_009595 [Brachionus plicatilis]